jgi:SAM-dependent methyltransferase
VTEAGALSRLDDSVCAALRERCATAGYDEDLVLTMAGIAPSLTGTDTLPIVQHVLAKRGDAAADLARLFAYEDVLSAERAQQRLGEVTVSALLHARVLATTNDRNIKSNYHLRPIHGVYLLADEPTSGPSAVMPPAGTTRQIVQMLPPTMSGSVLDLGCGPGSMALIAARRGATRVVGTDINPRAIELARFNARLNGITNAEFRAGSLGEPVRGDAFQWILAQPPYVIQPSDSEMVTFLHGGPSGEEITLQFLSAMPDVLAPNGRALLLTETVARSDEPLHGRLRAALGDVPIDLIALTAPGPTPAIQVIAYASLEAPQGGRAYTRAAQRYLRHLERLDASAFHHALVVLRRHPLNGGRKRIDATVPAMALNSGDAEALDTLLAAIDLASLDSERLLGAAISPSRYAHWVQMRPRPEPRLEPTYTVKFAGGFAAEQRISPTQYVLCELLHQQPTIAAAAARYAERAELPEDRASAEVLAFVRQGLMRGLLEPRASSPGD